MTASALGILWLLWSREAGLRRFGLMAVLGTMASTATLLIGGYLHFLPVSVLYVSAAFPLLLGSAGALCRSFSATATGERRAAVALLLVLAAALSPSTVSYMTDGARFDYRPALTHITANDPRGTVVIWPRVQAMWGAPDLESIELRSTTPLSLFDSLSDTRDRFWVITSRRRYGIIGDAEGGNSNGSCATATGYLRRVHRDSTPSNTSRCCGNAVPADRRQSTSPTVAGGRSRTATDSLPPHRTPCR